VGRYVAAVLCAALVVPAATAAGPSPLLRRASALTGLRIVRPVRIVHERGPRFDSDLVTMFDRTYPRSAQRLDEELYTDLGLLRADQSLRSALVASAFVARAGYDPTARTVRARTSPAPGRSELLRELARALVDQNFNLRRLNGLRARDRDAALAAEAVVEGVAALASRAHSAPVRGAPLQRFLTVEANAGVEFGEKLVAQLRYVGGRSAVASALRSFPRTTAQVLQLDRFLDHDPATPISFSSSAGDSRLSASETFGELDVLALLRAFAIANADAIAAGWSGGRIALYTAPKGDAAALVLRWRTDDAAKQWSATLAPYVAAAFPGAIPRTCPAVTACWLDGTHELAVAGSETTTIFVSGLNAELIAATLDAAR
jgi:hypothetical protein